jgi:acyl dehydratase
MLTLTTALGLVFRDASLLPKGIVALTNLHRVRFERDVSVGDTIHVDCTISRKREISGERHGLVEVEFQTLDQHGEVVVWGAVALLAARRVADAT